METLAAPSVPAFAGVERAMTSVLESELKSAPTSVKFIEVELATESYVTVLKDFAVAYRSFNKSLTPHVLIAAQALKKEFGVRQGCPGKELKVEGVVMNWKGFVKKYFDISPSRFNQILAIEDAPKVKKVVDRPIAAKTLTQQIDQCDDERELDEAFAKQEETIVNLEARLEAADEEKAALEQKLADLQDGRDEELQNVEEQTLMAVASDWQNLAVEALSGKASTFVKMELSRLLDELKLASKLTICDVE